MTDSARSTSSSAEGLVLSVSTVVSRLVDRGLVRRVRSGTDARSVELSLSARGRQVIARAPDLAQERLVRAIQSLPARRQPLLAATLVELAQAVDAGDQAPLMFFEERGRQKRSPRA